MPSVEIRIVGAIVVAPALLSAETFIAFPMLSDPAAASCNALMTQFCHHLYGCMKQIFINNLILCLYVRAILEISTTLFGVELKQKLYPRGVPGRSSQFGVFLGNKSWLAAN